MPIVYTAHCLPPWRSEFLELIDDSTEIVGGDILATNFLFLAILDGRTISLVRCCEEPVLNTKMLDKCCQALAHYLRGPWAECVAREFFGCLGLLNLRE